MSDQPLLPETGYLRLAAVLKLFPVGRSTWWAGIKDGRYPRSYKLGLRAVGWRCEDIRALIKKSGK